MHSATSNRGRRTRPKSGTPPRTGAFWQAFKRAFRLFWLDTLDFLPAAVFIGGCCLLGYFFGYRLLAAYTQAAHTQALFQAANKDEDTFQLHLWKILEAVQAAPLQMGAGLQQLARTASEWAAPLFWTLCMWITKLLHNIGAELFLLVSFVTSAPTLIAWVALSGFAMMRLRPQAATAAAAVQPGQAPAVPAPAPRVAPAEDAEDDEAAEMINVLMVKEREANQKLMEHRAEALRARNEGFPIPVRRVGDIDCESRKERLHERVSVEGSFPHRPGRSALQDLIVSDWHPMRVVVGEDGAPKEVVNNEDPKLLQIEKAYPGLGAAEFVLQVWQELQRFNSSGGYTVEIPWHAAQERELTPAEVTGIIRRGKGKRKKKKKKGGR